MPSKKLLGASAPERHQSPLTTPPTSISSISAPTNELRETLSSKKLALEDSGGTSCSLKRQLTRLGGRPVDPEHQIEEDVAANNSGTRVKAVNQGRKNYAVRSSKNVAISPKKHTEGGMSSEKERYFEQNLSSLGMDEENQDRVEEKNAVGGNNNALENEGGNNLNTPESEFGGRRGIRGFELRKRKSIVEKPDYVKQARARDIEGNKDNAVLSSKKMKFQQVPYNKGLKFLETIEFDGAEYSVGDDVYVKRKNSSSDSEDDDGSDVEVEACRLCSSIDEETKLECDGCLGGFHLSCLIPPLEEVPDGDWFCPDCSQTTNGARGPRVAEKREGQRRTARERLLDSELWAARIRK